MTDISGVNINDISLDLSNQDKYTNLFNKLTEKKTENEKFLTNEEFETAVKTNFGVENNKINTELTSVMQSLTNSSENDNITLKSFNEKMQFFEKVPKELDTDVVVNVVNATNTAINTDATTTNTDADTDTPINGVNDANADTNDVVPAPTIVVEAYAIIQINTTGIITVLDAVPEGTQLTEGSPYNLLANKTPSTFAVKIVKKEKDAACGVGYKIKCIDYGKSVYEMDLSGQVVIDNSKILREDFLKGADSNVNGANSNVNGANSNVNGANSNDNGANSNDNGANSNDNGANSNVNGANSNVNGANSNDNGVNSNDNGANSNDNSNDNGANSTNSGGSRKARPQKSKKTKRKYYVYKK